MLDADHVMYPAIADENVEVDVFWAEADSE